MKYLPGLVKGPTGGKLASGLDDVIICTMSELEVSWTLKLKKKTVKIRIHVPTFVVHK